MKAAFVSLLLGLIGSVCAAGTDSGAQITLRADERTPATNALIVPFSWAMRARAASVISSAGRAPERTAAASSATV